MTVPQPKKAYCDYRRVVNKFTARFQRYDRGCWIY